MQRLIRRNRGQPGGEYGPSSYGAYVPELPGIGVAGETEDEVRGLVEEAMERGDNAAAESVVVNHYTIAV